MSHYHAHSIEIFMLVWDQLSVKNGKIVVPTDASIAVREYLEEHFNEKNNTTSAKEKDMYFLYKTGVYGHGVFWIGDNLEEGKKAADAAASKDKDDYHEWELHEFTEAGCTYTRDSEHPVVYRGVRRSDS